MSISKKAKDRILRLCDYMEALPRESAKHFHMRRFFDHDGDHEHEIGEKPRLKDIHTCGTTACALGYAMTLPYFRKAGLTFVPELGVVENSHDVFDLEHIESENSVWDDLFGGFNDDHTPKQWAKRVRKLVRKWERTASPT